MITGKDLIKLGYKPSKWFGQAIDAINHTIASGVEWSDKEIKVYCDTLLPPPEILPRESPLDYHLNLEANTPDEVANMNMVIETMDELMKVPTLVGGAVMPDACPTGKVGQIPVGGVAVAKNAIHPGFHSSDICCSLYATNFGKIDPKKLLDTAHETTQFGPGGRKGLGGWATLLDDNPLIEEIESNYFTQDYVEKARFHIGTQGDGNHFLFVGRSEKTQDIWMITHHGSRGFGASVYKKGMHVANKHRKEISPKTAEMNSWIPYDTIEGKMYWKALQIVREWTKLNHASIHNRVANVMKVSPSVTFWNEHNFVFKDGELFFHAKGATPLWDIFVPDGLNDTPFGNGQRIVPLNMSEPILFVRGHVEPNNLGFAPHGAGRNMSRSEHKRRIEKKGLTPEDVLKIETEGLDVRFYSGKPDVSELPSAYKNANEVQRQMEKFKLGNVIDRIMPYGTIMAGEQEKPWLNKKKK